MQAEIQKERELKAKKEVEIVYEGNIFSVHVEKYNYDMNQKQTKVNIVHPGAAMIIPLTNNGHALFVRQWRSPIQKITLEFPSGVIDPGEEPINTAQRELQEEACYKANKLSPVRTVYTVPGFCSEAVHIFVAQELSYSPLPRDPFEEIDVLELSYPEIEERISSGEIVDIKTLYGVLLCKEIMQELSQNITPK